MKKQPSIIILITIFGLFISSCVKQDNVHQAYAGPKKITKYQYYKADTNGVFSKLIYDIDTLGTVILWDNASDTYNDAWFKFTSLPAGFNLRGVGTGSRSIGWYIDAERKKTLTFFSEPNAGNVYFATYALEKKGKKITLTGVFDAGQNSYKEIIELTEAE